MSCIHYIETFQFGADSRHWLIEMCDINITLVYVCPQTQALVIKRWGLCGGAYRGFGLSSAPVSQYVVLVVKMALLWSVWIKTTSTHDTSVYFL